MASNMFEYNIKITIILNECVTISHADITSSLESYWILFKHTSNISMLVGIQVYLCTSFPMQGCLHKV